MTVGGATTPQPALVFLLDVDNTLLDNDRLKRDIDVHLRTLLGDEGAEGFWATYEQVRHEQDVVDYPLTVKRWDDENHDPQRAKQIAQFLDSIPFGDYLYPHAMDAIAHMKSFGTVVILSDGDQVFQRRKIKNSGLEAAVDDNVLIYVHKEDELSDVFSRYPANHYVVVDDKPRILSSLERDCPTQFSTIMVMQGHYAREGEYSPEPDIEVASIGQLRDFRRPSLGRNGIAGAVHHEHRTLQPGKFLLDPVAQTAWMTGTSSAASAVASHSSAAPEPPVASIVTTSASTCPPIRLGTTCAAPNGTSFTSTPAA